MGYNEFYEARNVIEEFLKKDLFGPVKEKEVIDEDPLGYYTLGVLSPQKMKREIEEQEENEGFEDIQDEYDKSVSLSNSYNPSSMAITTTLKPSVKKIEVVVSAASYISNQREEVYEKVSRDDDGNILKDENNEAIKEIVTKKAYSWIRNPISEKVVIDIQEKLEKQEKLIVNGLELQVFTQKIFKDKSKLITIALVNKFDVQTSYHINNEHAFFQCAIECTGADVEEAFIEKKMQIDLSEDEEMKNFEMLYSYVKNYGVGHGCSIGWDDGANGATKIYSTFIPEYELMQMKPAINVDSSLLRMKFLAEGTKEVVCNALTELNNSYNTWIESLKENIQDDYQEYAELNISLCIETSERIAKSIDILKNNSQAFRAFQLANRAMLNQRKKFLKNTGKGVDYNKITWYPFQLAFILQELQSITEPECKYRDIVDLLWFPTGGGKTEAYLGLSAFTIFYRRISKSSVNNAGVTIIMRYTLRLLTIQQFERAAALICACELIRKKENLGGDEISIGLWVGGGLTPNSLADAETALKDIKEGKYVGDGNPVQVLKCPWCGDELNENNYFISKGRLVIKCDNVQCDFNGKSDVYLPIYLVDEDIYNNTPTLIISTVDKFARMAWEPNVGSIFGLRGDNLPPELIIQDELHLISGPLGTITGLYEVAVRKFCDENGIKAKVIASTATIRNAESQILSLYGKEFRQFPPKGLDMRDSYFAVESTRDDRPSRKYIGVLSPTKSPSTLLIRVYASILYGTRVLKDKGYSEEVIDAYWTLVGYFNSLRELGGALVQVLDDVQDRYKFLYNTKFKDVEPDFTLTKKQDHYEELTSRKKNSEISEIIQKKLKVSYPSRDAFDIVLASNMISVGVDVGRLGVMGVTGQPKTNAEYIQATSRVGRENPGLVVTMFNPSHSRDRSHYEQFKSFHSAVYKHIEATSITPFSDRARDRALHGVFISLCRQLIAELNSNSGAQKINEVIDDVEEIKDYLVAEARKIDSNEANNVLTELNNIISIWSEAATDELVYQKKKNSSAAALLINSGDDGEGYPTLNSMRNVDVQSNLFFEED